MLGPIPMLLLSLFVDPAGLSADSRASVRVADTQAAPPPPVKEIRAAKLKKILDQRKTAAADKADKVKAEEKKFGSCKNKHENCDFWESIGECTKNEKYMRKNCKLACGLCSIGGDPETQLQAPPLKKKIVEDPKLTRCKRDTDDHAILGPGGINRVFRRIATDAAINEKYNVTVHSRDPWIVTLDNFVSKDEGEALIKSLDGKFERSSSVGKKVDAGTFAKEFTDYRTSYNAWCNMHPCVTGDAAKSIQQKIAEITMTEVKHQEYMQVLDYDVGQYYKQHHDFIPGQSHMPCGPRIFTAFMYFEDVEEGGETKFNNLNIMVKPKAGRMLLWPHVKNSNLELMDGRTEHEAMPVIKGKKLAANAWVHLFNFRKYNALGCTG